MSAIDYVVSFYLSTKCTSMTWYFILFASYFICR